MHRSASYCDAGASRPLPTRNESSMDLDLSGVTIVFDLDGTLVDTAPDLAAAANHVFASLGLAPVSPAELHPFISHGSRAMIEQGLRRHGMSKTPGEIAKLHALFF